MMVLIAEFVFWICVGLIFHSYVLFPLLLQVRTKSKHSSKPSSSLSQPIFVSIVMAAYNEEEVIEEKIQSILANNFPTSQYEILVGSDCSTDRTSEIVDKLAKKHKEIIKLFDFKERQGKPQIINQLIQDSKGEILILTDANVIFDENTINELIHPFQNSKIGLVDSQMINKGARSTGISVQEKAYISREVSIKNHESILWGSMMGPFGGCFAIRKDLYRQVPSNFLVDDFYLNMSVLENGFQAINNPKAKVFEDVSNDLAIEYRRKIRIATGNFQNLARFKKLLWPPWSGIAFSFFSHKVIRWLGPFLLLLAFISLVFIYTQSLLYLIALAGFIGLLFVPLLDYFLKKLSIHISFFRFITHFCAMNLALFVGFIRYLKGVQSNVWQPTKRNQ